MSLLSSRDTPISITKTKEMIFSTLLPALLAVGSLPSSIAEPSRLTRTREQPSSDEVGTSDRFEQIDKRARLTQTYSGEKIADRAEIAGLMATFRTAPYKASYFYIINEYGDDELVRQNACEQSSNGKLDYNMLFVSISPFKYNRMTWFR